MQSEQADNRQAMEDLQAGAARAGASGLNVQAAPGSIWAMLSRLAWADTSIVRAHSMVFEVPIQGTAPLGVPTDGAATEAPGTVVARAFFLVHTMTGFIERDVINPAEDESSFFVTVQIEDEARQAPVYRTTGRMAALAGTKNVPGVPLRFDEAPLLFVPQAQILVTFQPRAGFPVGISAITGLTTRIAGIHLHGALVTEPLVDRLIAANLATLANNRLIPQRA
jgi:hypothetical protein